MAGQFGKFTSFTETGLDAAADRLDRFTNRGLSDAVRQGLDEYGFRLGVAAYRNMKIPSQPPNSPNYVGLHWKRTKQFHSPPEKIGEAEWRIMVRPQFMALWQEVGTKAHTLFNPNKLRAKAFYRQKKIEEAKLAKIAEMGSDPEKAKRYDRDRRRASRKIQELKAARGQVAPMGYSEPKYIPKGKRNKNSRSDWFKGNTPTATAGKRAGQSRPVMVRADRNIRVGAVAATRPIERAVDNVIAAHRDRMAALLKQAYERRS